MFKKLKSALSLGGDVIQKDLERLDTHGKGLGEQAVRYVRSGEGGAVLSTLANTQIPTETLFSYRYQDPKNELSFKRRAFFLDSTPYETDLMARYAEVLGASRTMNAPRDREMAGPDKAAPALRLFFAQAFQGAISNANSYPRKARDEPVEGMVIDRAIEIGAAFDASPADVLAIMLWIGDHWAGNSGEHYLECVDFTGYATQHPETIIEAAKQLNAQSRVALANRLRNCELTGTQPYLGLMFEFAGGSAKSVREAAGNALLALPAETVEPLATDMLEKGTVAAREGMVALLGKLDTGTAAAALEAHLKVEKAARVRSAIENLLVTKAVVSDAGSGDQATDDATGYEALDGTRVEIPPLRMLEDDGSVQFGDDTRARIEAAAIAHNDAATKTNKELDRIKQKWGRVDLIKNPAKMAKTVVAMLNSGDASAKIGPEGNAYSIMRHKIPALSGELAAEIPLKRLLQLSVTSINFDGTPPTSFLSHQVPQQIRSWLETPEGDLRTIENFLIEDEVELRLGGWNKRVKRICQKGDFVYEMMPSYDWNLSLFEEMDPEARWPIIAENLQVLDEAFGLRPRTELDPPKYRAVTLVSWLPKTPARYYGPLLDIATGETKAGRAEARNLLAEAQGVDDRLIALLSDSRQSIRAGAAEWLADRRCAAAIKPLKARLKKEKSELARAAILTALQDLGEDLSSFVGPSALIKEAETGLKKAKFDKLEWLGLDHLPKLKWRAGKPVPDTVPRWWLFLANKLKQPGGNALFEIYLDQLAPESAEALSAWIFDSWISYDTKQRSEEEGIAHAKANVKASFQSWLRWDKTITEEAVFQMLKRDITSQYLNSGAASKGILALATRVPPTRAADRVKQYLRTHGKRTSQATSLLEMLAAKGDPVSLQVVIGAATRLKQKGVQAKAGEMVEAVAEARGWSMSELADRTIPTGGLDDEGLLELPCGPDEKIYQARLADDLALTLSNPDGKVVKGLPSGDDDNTKAAKKQLSTSKKEIKQVTKAQADRLYEALCAERVWPVSDWQRDFQDHPIMRRLTPRVVWIGLDANGQQVRAFRPAAEGDLTDAEDNPVDLGSVASVRLAHGALLTDADADAWQSHLKDYEITPLFSQFGRPLLRLDKDLKEADEITDRLGWMTDAFTIRGAASKLGYDRGEALDGGFFCDYIKPFKTAGLIAVIEFSGNGLPEENVSAVLKKLSFVQRYSGYRARKVPLKDVPPVLLSECWNDYHEMAAKAAFDPDWEKKVPW